jgi:hypothetical protein
VLLCVDPYVYFDIPEKYIDSNSIKENSKSTEISSIYSHKLFYCNLYYKHIINIYLLHHWCVHSKHLLFVIS